MPDLLVKLYELPDLAPHLERARAGGIEIRRALAPEKHVVTRWIEEQFSLFWKSEAEVAFSQSPISLFVATKEERCVGFCCYDTSARGFYGPVGVDEEERGSGLGTALSLAVFHDMRAQGYGYAIIGWAGPVKFYEKIVGATVIPGSEPGVYRGMLRPQSRD